MKRNRDKSNCIVNMGTWAQTWCLLITTWILWVRLIFQVRNSKTSEGTIRNNSTIKKIMWRIWKCFRSDLRSCLISLWSIINGVNHAKKQVNKMKTKVKNLKFTVNYRRYQVWNLIWQWRVHQTVIEFKNKQEISNQQWYRKTWALLVT